MRMTSGRINEQAMVARTQTGFNLVQAQGIITTNTYVLAS
ncbi:MAG: hypothetical protein NVS2B7_37910 [Herpetosiphon sp.]